MTEYRDRFIELSRYAPADVVDDEDKQDHFGNGLSGPVRYQLLCHTFWNFQELVDNAIKVEHARKEMGDMKGRWKLRDSQAITVPVLHRLK